MHRINPETGEVLVPHVFDDGTYGAADPKLGKRRHHIANRVVAESIEELKEYLRKGWPVWMSIRGTKDRRLISKGIIDADPPQSESAPCVAPQAEIIAAQSIPRVPAQGHMQFVPIVRSAGAVTREVTECLQIIASMSEAEVSAEIDDPRRLLMATHVHKSKRLDIAYAPFDHVNIGADIVIVGITPGKQQMRAALEDAYTSIKLGLSDAEVLARAKVHASFAGTMRTNLVKLMDAVGLNVLLGIASTVSLWGVDSRRAHFTSALRYPTFVDGQNYSRSPDMNGVPFLFDRSRNWLKEELSLFPDAVIVPMAGLFNALCFGLTERDDFSLFRCGSV
ncbi:MAG: hypothetical protein ACR65T_03840 [Methylocystis sp.]|uniref:hypothetical protein n=1 Tax=Methylocystis sp. TaxID=1911079 RepID=UPI003DA63B1B